MKRRFGGVIPALVTPYRPDGTVHHESLAELVESLLARGVTGFYVCGSTGEAFLLSEPERMAIAETVVGASAGRVPTIVHVGSIATDQALRLAAHATETGADAISAVPPFYYPFTRAEIWQYYRDLLAATELPMIVYNFPASSGVELNADTAGELLSDERVAAVKHTSMDMYQLERMKRIREDLIVLNGRDEAFLAGMAMGADGAIGSTFNLLAEEFLALREHHAAGEGGRAAAMQRCINDFIEKLISVGVFSGIKYLLEQQGFACGACRRPFLELSDCDRRNLDTAWERLRASDIW